MASCTTWRTVCFAARGTNRGGAGWGRTGGYAPPRRPRLGAGDGRRGAPGAEHPGALGDPGTGSGRGRSGLAEQVSTGGEGRTFGGGHGRLRALGCRPV